MCLTVPISPVQLIDHCAQLYVPCSVELSFSDVVWVELTSEADNIVQVLTRLTKGYGEIFFFFNLCKEKKEKGIIKI